MDQVEQTRKYQSNLELEKEQCSYTHRELLQRYSSILHALFGGLNPEHKFIRILSTCIYIIMVSIFLTSHLTDRISNLLGIYRWYDVSIISKARSKREVLL
jgi:hypothetical protein